MTRKADAGATVGSGGGTIDSELVRGRILGAQVALAAQTLLGECQQRVLVSAFGLQMLHGEIWVVDCRRARRRIDGVPETRCGLARRPAGR